MKEYPKISILIAARNEEDNIEELLHSLDKLSYPKSALQILIGNDASTDKTAQIISNFIESKPQYKLLDIKPSDNHLRGKTNVLAQLAHEAGGEYFFFTDADIEVPKNWIQAMLKLFGLHKNIGIIVGITLVKSKNWFEACQAIEWIFALKMMHFLGNIGIKTTGMGNNMAVSAEAYRAVGGYENLPFSIVEDYAIYKAITDKGYGFQHGFTEEIMTSTKPPKNYFEQRKRWVTGGMESKSNLIIPALIQGMALPILLIISIFCWKTSLTILIANTLINIILGIFILKEINQLNLAKYLPVYSMYMLVFWFLQFVSYFLPTKLVWKDRAY